MCIDKSWKQTVTIPRMMAEALGLDAKFQLRTSSQGANIESSAALFFMMIFTG
jgi:hypothetical protein